MKKGIISIIVDEKGSLDVRFQGEDAFLLPLLGSLAVAGDFLKDKLLKQNSVGKKWSGEDSSGNDSKNEYIEEEKMNKKEAIEFYLSQREKIEARLQTIAKSNGQAKFSVNKTLFSKI